MCVTLRGNADPTTIISKSDWKSHAYSVAESVTSKSAVVVGGGIVGLTSAWRLARHGCQVTLMDPAPGRGATWAAAGMIAPSAEISPGEQANFELQRHA